MINASNKKKEAFLLLLLVLVGVVIAYLAISVFGGQDEPAVEIGKPAASPFPNMPAGRYNVVDEEEFSEDVTHEELVKQAEKNDKPIPVKEKGTVQAIDFTDHVKGDTNTPVSVTFYADYTNAYSRLSYLELDGFYQQNKDNIHLIYRHYPLSSKPLSNAAAVAVECTLQQIGRERFWEVTNAMYKDPTILERHIYETLNTFGINEEELKICEGDGQMQLLPQYMKTRGGREEVIGVPAYVFYNQVTGNKNVVHGIASNEYLQQVLDDILQ